MQGSYGASLVVRAIASWAMLFGVLIFLGDEGRFSHPAYALINLLPGSPFTWGAVLIIAGFIAIFGSINKSGLPFLPQFTMKWPVVDWEDKRPRIKLHSAEVVWSSTQIRNIGLWILAFWFLIFGVAVAFTLAAGIPIPLGAGSRDMLLSVICVIMTKVREPAE